MRGIKSYTLVDDTTLMAISVTVPDAVNWFGAMTFVCLAVIGPGIGCY